MFEIVRGYRFVRYALMGVSVCLCIMGNASAANYIVSSASQISSVMTNQAHPGDTLSMTAGTWTNQAIVFKGNGTASLPIVLRAQGGYGSVTLTGTSTLKIAGNYLIVDGLKFENGRSSSDGVIEFRHLSSGIESNYSRLTNSAVINYNPASSTTDYKWISIYGTHNRVDHCYVEGKNHAGTTLVVWRATTAPNYHRIDHNYFGPRPELGVNGGETIRIGTSDQSLSSSYTVVESNYFYKCNGETEIISNKSCDNIYRYNTFVDCEGTLTLRHGNRCLVEGNYFFGNGISNTGGIRIIGEDHVVINNYIAGTKGSGFKSALTLMDGIENSPLSGYFQVKRAIVAFNTLVSNDYSFHLGAGKDSDNVLPPLDCIIANNIVYGTRSPLITLTDTPIAMTWQKNIFYGASLGISPTPSGITITDPKLASAGSDGIRHLSNLSPAINASEGTYNTVLFDIDGQPRDGQKDIGADEYSNAPITVKPLTVNDVGPNAGSYTITVTQTPHGTISPGTTSVFAGNTQKFTITPAVGYHVDSLIVDGANVADSIASYTFVNVLSAHTLYAVFGTKQYTLAVHALHGMVTRSPDREMYDSASTVLVTAIADTHYHFTGWSGDTSGAQNPFTVIMNDNKTITASFAANSYDLNISTQGEGSVMKNPDKAGYEYAELVEITAVPASGWTFSGWSGDTVSGSNPITIQMTGAKNIIATFVPSLMLFRHELRGGWNLLSLPLVPSERNVRSLYPQAVSGAFIFDNGYIMKDTIENGAGFWLKYPSPDSVFVTGFSLEKDTISLRQGWNLIGALTVPVSSATVVTEPADLIESQFFLFNEAGYVVSDTLLPGVGYWIKANANGTIILR